jgi:8-oxo-dGTP pyrophosphatase MutT (NUDIX family)
MTGTAEEVKTVNRDDLIIELKSYAPIDGEDTTCIDRFINLLQSDRCFYRDHFEPGHITGSAILLNQTGDQILMNHHKSLNMWLNFGGHCDGEEDVLAVAIRETMEESGITAIKPITSDIIDIDIHTIPANDKKNEPTHCHYDIRYIMQMTGKQDAMISNESLALQWMTFDEAIAASPNDKTLERFINKTRGYIS